ncbi:MAG: isocitrate dehydrogenase [Nitrospira sp.]|nr:isocitrate dehydrogenase [Nitrospira sp.]MBX3340010.1 isocitrate dehydrogenase [Nitrospira sp.]MBX3369607.1 isocitrate dehydrogenase [Nitrospira sp.]MBX7039073.1 isocitrate dehydrogenase [Nitrospira sp.]MCW5793505.1 isocitrate dehydrogenase [Nitrospira sp.]
MATTFSEAAKATRKKKVIKLVGVDMYIVTEEGIPKFPDGEFGPFKCEFISNRGTKVWPGFVSPDLMMVNWYRCRFMATGDVTDADVDTFLAVLTKKGWWWSAAQKLWTHDGEPAFSKAY